MMPPMNLYLKLMLILLGLAYLISPVDIIPELLLPYVGWIDDGVVLWTIFHLIRHGTLPPIFMKKKPGGGKPIPPQQEASPQKKSPPKSAHEILGVSPHAAWPEIQAAYKEKIKQYHPDKLSHLGEEFSNLANEKFLEIQKAYDSLNPRKKTNHKGTFFD